MGFKRKTIKAILSRKIDAWVDSIEHEGLREDVRKNVIVTGGAIASMLLHEPVSDYDVYLRSYELTVRLAKYYVDKFKSRTGRGEVYIEELTDIRGQPRVRIVVKSAGVASETEDTESYQYFEGRPDEEGQNYVADVFDDPVEVAEVVDDVKSRLQEKTKSSEVDSKPYQPKFLSSNAISLSGDVQVILRFWGEPEDVHATYDFVHCTNYWDSKTRELVTNEEALHALLSKSLVYRGSLYPVASIIRLRKFIKRGWKVNAGQILKIVMQVAELDLKDYNVLEDQLTGVDVAYFEQMISRLKGQSPESVRVNGEDVLTIESNSLCGKSDLSPLELDAIRTAANHLLAFAGQPSRHRMNQILQEVK